MLRPLRAALPRAPPSPASRPSFAISRAPLRQYSSQQQPPSATGVFYKTFTRPVAKCALLAVLFYQLVYFGWTKLEVNEIKEERQAEILKLEAQVRGLQAARAAEEAAVAGASAGGDGVGAKGQGDANGTGKSWWRWK